MRLLILNYEYPPIGGGAGNAAWFLCREWGRQGHYVDIVTTWFAGLDETSKESERITVHRVKSLRKKNEQSNPVEMLSYVLKGYGRAYDLLKDNQYNRIIAFFSIPSGIIAYRLWKRKGIPYIVLLRGGDVPGFLPGQLGLFHWITLPFTKKIWRRAGCVIANSTGLAGLAAKTARKIDVLVDIVPNGVDTDFFSPAPYFPAGPFTFLFVGRFSVQKNILVLLDQFEKYVGHSGGRLLLVGDGPKKKDIERRVASSPVLIHSVTLYPWCSKEALLRFYQLAHCFVNPSLYEGLPNALLEAMACGLPVIASNVGGNNELVKPAINGFLFDLSYPDSLGKSMQDIIGCGCVKVMGEASRRTAMECFSWAKSAAGIVNCMSISASSGSCLPEKKL
jgi:glycosyltransferase involved in cell wall biosynthesis